MNAEISRIRKLRNQKEEFDHEPQRLSEDRMSARIVEINTNMAELYKMQRDNAIDVNEYIFKLVANIYTILNIFDEMGVYPDYFYDEIVKMNIDYKKHIDNNSTLRGNYRLFRQTELSSNVSKAIKNGLENGYYKAYPYPKKDVNDSFLEIIGFFQAFNIPYGIETKEQCAKAFNEIEYNHFNIMEELSNCDYCFEDIEYLSRLLFEYLTFFVAIGVNPKEYLDKYIDTHAKEEYKLYHK